MPDTVKRRNMTEVSDISDRVPSPADRKVFCSPAATRKNSSASNSSVPSSPRSAGTWTTPLTRFRTEIGHVLPAFSDGEFAGLRMPVLLAVGNREAMYNARSTGYRARQLMPRVEVEIIPDAGYMLTTDQTDETMLRLHRRGVGHRRYRSRTR